MKDATKELKNQGVSFSTGYGEDKSMHRQFVDNICKHRLSVWKDVRADGNCFFHSVVFILDAVGLNKERSKVLIMTNIVFFRRYLPKRLKAEIYSHELAYNCLPSFEKKSVEI